MNLLILAGFVSWVAWMVMLVAGILHSAGVVPWTLGYDQASAIAWCVVPLLIFYRLFGIYLEMIVHRIEARKLLDRADPFSDVDL